VHVFSNNERQLQGSRLKAAFHDTDIDTDTNILREDPREDVSVGVDVGVAECGLNCTVDFMK